MDGLTGNSTRSVQDSVHTPYSLARWQPCATSHISLAWLEPSSGISSGNWQNFFEGFLAHGWAEVQQAYYTWAASCRTGMWWAIALIQKLSDIAWDLWEHRNGHVHHTSHDNLVHQRVATSLRQEYGTGSATLAPATISD